jgi:hypothetical protein
MARNTDRSASVVVAMAMIPDGYADLLDTKTSGA